MQVSVVFHEVNPDSDPYFVGRGNWLAGNDSVLAHPFDYDPDSQSKSEYCDFYLDFLRSGYKNDPAVKEEMDKLATKLIERQKLVLLYAETQEQWCAEVLAGSLHKLAIAKSGSVPVKKVRKFRRGDYVTGVPGRRSHGWFGIIEDVTVKGYDHINQCDRVIYFVDWYERSLDEELKSAVLSATPDHIQPWTGEEMPSYNGEPGATERCRRRRNPSTSLEIWLNKPIEPGTGNMSRKQKSRTKKRR